MWNRTSELLVTDNATSYANNVTTNGTLQNVKENISVPDGCYVVRFEDMEFLPWDNPDNIVNAAVEDIARKVKDNLLPIFFLIGWPANVINMAVFYKQGLKERVNLCLFALSLADELSLIYTMFLYGEQPLHLQFITKELFGPMMTAIVNNNLVGFFGFNWVSMVLSAIIASERCLCVLSPLRFQTLLPTGTMAVIIAALYLVVVGFFFLVGTKYRIACILDPASDTVLKTIAASEFYRSHEKLINYLDSFVYGAGIPGIVIIVVTTTTIITTMKIRQAAAWRAGASSASGSLLSSSSPISVREIALTKMLIGSSVLFIVCIFPFALFRFAWLFLPEMNTGGRHQNFFLAGLWILEPFSYVNWSFNIFVYYTMGSHYRETFWSLVGKKKQDNTKKIQSLTKATNI